MNRVRPLVRGLVLYRFLILLFRDLMPNAHHLFWVELLMEVESLHDAADFLADFVCAPVGHREERLLSVRALIQAAIERGIR
jgi:hypothetical protein